MRRKPQQQRSRELVGRVIDAATQVFDELGYSTATTNDIADAAGVSIGSLYQYFDDKDDILASLYHRHLDEVGPTMITACRSHPAVKPEEWAEQLVATLFEVNQGHLARVLYESATPPEGARQRVDEILAAMAQASVPHLRRWGVPSASSRAEALVVSAVAVVHQVGLRTESQRDKQRVSRSLIAMISTSLRPAVRPSAPMAFDLDEPGETI